MIHSANVNANYWYHLAADHRGILTDRSAKTDYSPKNTNHLLTKANHHPENTDHHQGKANYQSKNTPDQPKKANHQSKYITDRSEKAPDHPAMTTDLKPAIHRQRYLIAELTFSLTNKPIYHE